MKVKKKEHNHKKKYGQNFLDDNYLLENIEKSVNILDGDNIIEIGPGLGFLTNMILSKGVNLTCFEIDDDLIPVLNKKFGKFENFKLIHTDFLEYDLNNVVNNKEYRVIANIPYYITAPIITRLIEFKDNIKDIYLMVQKEVAQRLDMNSATSNRSVFTHAVQFFGEVEYLFTVGKEMFDPVPKVDSAFIRISLYKDRKYEKYMDFEKYIYYVKAAFENKRKNLSNNFKNIGIEKSKTESYLNKMGKSITARAEELDILDFITLINLIEEGKNE